MSPHGSVRVRLFYLLHSTENVSDPIVCDGYYVWRSMRTSSLPRRRVIRAHVSRVAKTCRNLYNTNGSTPPYCLLIHDMTDYDSRKGVHNHDRD